MVGWDFECYFGMLEWLKCIVELEVWIKGLFVGLAIGFVDWLIEIIVEVEKGELFFEKLVCQEFQELLLIGI